MCSYVWQNTLKQRHICYGCDNRSGMTVVAVCSTGYRIVGTQEPLNSTRCLTDGRARDVNTATTANKARSLIRDNRHCSLAQPSPPSPTRSPLTRPATAASVSRHDARFQPPLSKHSHYSHSSRPTVSKTDWAKVLRPTRHKVGSFRRRSSQPIPQLSTEKNKQRKQTTQEEHGKNAQKATQI